MQLFLSIFIFLSISFSSVMADTTTVTEDKLISIVEKQDMKFEYFKETTELNLKHKLDLTEKSLDKTNAYIEHTSDRIDNISASVDRFAMLTTFFGVLITIIVFFFSFKSNSEARHTVEDWLEENGDDFVRKEIEPIKESFNKMIFDMKKEMENFKHKSDEEIKSLKEQLEEKGNEAIESLSSKIIENDISDTETSLLDNPYLEFEIKAIQLKPLSKRTFQDNKKIIMFYIKNKQYIKAKNIIDKQLKVKIYTNEEKGLILHLKGLLEYRQKLYDASIQSFNESLDIAPKLISNYTALAKIYSLIKRDYTKAIELSKRALTLDENNYYSYVTLGFANRNIAYFQEKTNQYNKAIEYIHKAIEINPDLKEAYHALGSIYLMQSKYSEAKKWYLIALENDLDNWEHHEWTFISLFTIDLILNRTFSNELKEQYLKCFSPNSKYFLTYKILQVLIDIRDNLYTTKEEIRDSIEVLTLKEKKIKYFFFYKLEDFINNEHNQDVKEKLKYALKLFDTYRIW